MGQIFMVRGGSRKEHTFVRVCVCVCANLGGSRWQANFGWDTKKRRLGGVHEASKLAWGTRNSTVLDLDIPETEFSRMNPFAHFSTNSARRSCHFGVIACQKRKRKEDRESAPRTDHRSRVCTRSLSSYVILKEQRRDHHPPHPPTHYTHTYPSPSALASFSPSLLSPSPNLISPHGPCRHICHVDLPRRKSTTHHKRDSHGNLTSVMRSSIRSGTDTSLIPYWNAVRSALRNPATTGDRVFRSPS